MLKVLTSLQSEIGYTYECLIENYFSEARSSLSDIEEIISKGDIPERLKISAREMIETAISEISGDLREPIKCERAIRQFRLRLSNEIAFQLGENLPYNEASHPCFTKTN